MKAEQFIYSVVDSFYQKARHDVLIGYHFRNIPDFDEHIPRIAAFWEIQLLGTTTRPLQAPFDMFNTHIVLGIKRGELGRWLMLFRASLEKRLVEHPEYQEMREKWEEKLIFFESVFTRMLLQPNP